MPHNPRHASAAGNPWRFWPALLLFAAIALFFLWEEHQAHLLGVLPYLILLLCPLLHLFMHHGHGRDKDSPHDQR
jgi:hypothetical protein